MMLTHEQRARFLFGLQRGDGGGAKDAPHVSPKRIGFSPCGFHQSAGNHRNIISAVLITNKYQATSTKIKTAPSDRM